MDCLRTRQTEVMPVREKEREALVRVDLGLVEFEACPICGVFSKVKFTKLQMQN